jgi:hypothetical protein
VPTLSPIGTFAETSNTEAGRSGLGVARLPRDPPRRDRLWLLNAFAIALLTLLGAAQEALGCDPPPQSSSTPRSAAPTRCFVRAPWPTPSERSARGRIAGTGHHLRSRARCASERPDWARALTAAVDSPASALLQLADIAAERRNGRVGPGADFMKSHLESHHPLPIKTALSSGSSLRMRDRAFHKPE